MQGNLVGCITAGNRLSRWLMALLGLLNLTTVSALAQVRPQFSLHAATMAITQVTPDHPKSGEQVVVTVQLTANPILPNAVTGLLSGTFADKSIRLNPIVGGETSQVTIPARSSVVRQFIIDKPTYGDDVVQLSFRALSTCNPRYLLAPAKCPDTTIVTATMNILIAPRLVMRRIAGTKFVGFANSPDSYAANGAMCVVHRPSCGGTFASGKIGKDHYFAADKLLPAGATLIAPSSTIYWPVDSSGRQLLNHTDRGSVFSQGSYGASADWRGSAAVPAFDMHWENTCSHPSYGTLGDWTGLPVTYEVSFIVQAPENVDLGEPTFDPATSPPPICAAADKPVAFVATSGGGTTPAQAAILTLSGPEYTPTNPVKNSNFVATVFFRNAGNIASKKVTVTFYIDSVVSSSTEVGPLDSGQVVTITTMVDGLPEGAYGLEWKIEGTSADLFAQIALFD